MKLIKTSLLNAALVAGGLLCSAQAGAFTLTFEGVGDNADIQNFYNGGTDSLGNSGPNYGVQFVDALGLVDADNGGNGNFANEPTPNTIMFFLNAATAVLDYAAGFTTGFSFYYTSSTVATVSVYDALGGAAGGGNILGSLNLTAQYTDNCVGDPSGTFCNFTPVGVAFGGTAYSIDFGGTANQTGYDNITFGSVNPNIPEPGTLALLGIGALAFCARRKVQA
ncbi:MAG TPA: PEP-CTERM sorting domain-containing protein [Accumulibacter sp.]|nr:PEP-CTERM sorting domain-containing protein [Accumulibacter sp.]